MSFDSLSARERQVAVAIACGEDRQAIAARLGLVDKTIDTHRLHVMQKLGVRNAVQLTRKLILEGHVSLHDEAP